jgi:uronate dehydrogenase
MKSGRVVLTGAAGRIGSVLREAWRGSWAMRLVDVRDVAPLADEEVLALDLADFPALRRAMAGVDVVVHLAAIPGEDSFSRLVEANVVGTYNVFEAARQTGVRRVVFASTNHVTGFYARRERVGPSDPVRPDSLYAVTKVFGEALGRLYFDKWGLEVVCVRIGSFGERPTTARALGTWLSERDAVQLFTKAMTAPAVGFLVVYGASRSRWSSWENPGAAVLGYTPLDDVEEAAAEDIKEEAEASGELLQGGAYATREYWISPP